MKNQRGKKGKETREDRGTPEENNQRLWHSLGLSNSLTPDTPATLLYPLPSVRFFRRVLQPK